MEKVSIIGLDLVKRSFRRMVPAPMEAWRSVRSFRERKCSPSLPNNRLALSLWKLRKRALLGTCDCDSGHEVRLIPPIYVKPSSSAKRTTRPTRRRSAKPRAGRPCASWRSKPRNSRRAPCCFCTRDLLVRQRTQLINALRGHLAEHGVVACKGRRMWGHDKISAI